MLHGAKCFNNPILYTTYKHNISISYKSMFVDLACDIFLDF